MGIIDLITGKDRKRAEEERRQLEIARQKSLQRATQSPNPVVAQKAQRTITYRESNPAMQKPTQSMGDKLRDVVDANTEMDYYRRQQQQLLSNSLPTRQDYMQEQITKGNRLPITNPALQITRTVGKPFWELGDVPVQAAKWGVGNITNNQTAAQNAKKDFFDSRNQGFITGSVNNWINSTGNIGTRLATGDKFINTDSLRFKEDILPVAASAADLTTYGLQATGVGTGVKTGVSNLLTKQVTKNVMKQGALQGTTGAVAGTYEPARQGQDWNKIAQSALTTGAVTATGGVVLPYVGAVAKPVLKPVANSTVDLGAKALQAGRVLRDIGKPTGQALQNLQTAKTNIDTQITDLLQKRSIAQTRKPDLVPILDRQIDDLYSQSDSLTRKMNTRGQGGYANADPSGS
jgi:hypothetical protein